MTEKMAFPGVIENSFRSELKVINCIFMENRYGEANNAAPFGYAIRSFGPISLESSCFLGNSFRAHGPVQVFGAPHASLGNYVDSSQADLTCKFLAVFSSQDGTTDIKPSCFDSDAKSCPLEVPPSMAETAPPVVELPKGATPSSSSIRGPTRNGVVIVSTILLTMLSTR